MKHEATKNDYWQAKSRPSAAIGYAYSVCPNCHQSSPSVGRQDLNVN